METIKINKEGIQYAEMLKKIRKDVDSTREAVNVLEARKAEDGSLVLKIQGKKEKLESLKSKIKNKVEGYNFVTNKISSSRRKIFHVKHIDAITTREEVEAALKGDVSEEYRGEIEVKSMRPSFEETQAATVLVPRGAVEYHKSGQIKIGMVMCSINERIEINRCYRCWGYGHIAKICKGEDRKDCCSNCSERGHTFKGCTKSSFCPLCDAVGHRASSLGCPVFKEYQQKSSGLPQAQVMKGLGKKWG